MVGEPALIQHFFYIFQDNDGYSFARRSNANSRASWVHRWARVYVWCVRRNGRQENTKHSKIYGARSVKIRLWFIMSRRRTAPCSLSVGLFCVATHPPACGVSLILFMHIYKRLLMSTGDSAHVPSRSNGRDFNHKNDMTPSSSFIINPEKYININIIASADTENETECVGYPAR